MIADILNLSIADHGIANHTLLAEQFSTILDSNSGGAFYKPWYEEPCVPYATLPLVINLSRRAKFLCMDATWRQLPLGSASGQLVHTLQVTNQRKAIVPGQTTDLSGGTVGFQIRAEEGNVYFNFPRGFTMGQLYDVMVVSSDYDHREWKLPFETGIKEKVQYGRFMAAIGSGREEPETWEVKSQFTHKHHCALMLTGIAERWVHYEGSERNLWRPEELEKMANVWSPFVWSPFVWSPSWCPLRRMLCLPDVYNEYRKHRVCTCNASITSGGQQVSFSVTRIRRCAKMIEVFITQVRKRGLNLSLTL